MEQLRQIFIDAKVPKEQIDNVIANLRLESIDDLGLYTDPQDFANAGVADAYSQRKLARYAKDLERERDVKMTSQASAAAEAQAEMAARERHEAAISTLEDVYTDNSSWLEALQQDNTLRFTTNTYVAGIKAALATNIGTFEAMPKLMKLLLDFAKANARSVPKAFYDLQALGVERKFGLIVGAANKAMVIDGVPIYASEGDMLDLLQDVKTILVPEVKDVVERVGRWYEALMSRSMGQYFMAQTTGVAGAPYPSTAPLREAAQNLRMSINRTFAGNGIQKALAICNQYTQFIRILDTPDLPQSVGVVDKDALLAQLNLDPSAAAVRSERPIINFIIHAMETDKCEDGKDELNHCIGLFNLAQQADWSGLTGDANDANFMEKFQATQQMTGTSQPMIGGRAYVASIDASQIRQMDGQPARLEVGSGGE